MVTPIIWYNRTFMCICSEQIIIASAAAMHDRTNECGASIGTELLEETGKNERVKLFNDFIYTYKKITGETL